MKKIICFIFCVSLIIFSYAQNMCVAVDCKRTIRLPQDTIKLHSQITTNDAIKTISWNNLNNTIKLDSPKANNTLARGLNVGTYIFAFTATTTKSSSTLNDTVIVLPANKPPVAIIQPIPPITLPTNTFILDGSKSIDSDGIIKSYLWSTGDTTPKVNITVGAAGNYNYTLVVADDQGAQNSASTSVIVNPAPILPPTVSIIGPSIVNGSTDTLIAIAVDPNSGGSIKQYGWGKLSGSGTQTIIGANTSKIIITGLQSGQYTFKVTVWNAAGLTGSASITFTVNQTTKTISKIIIYYSDGTIQTIP